MSNRQYLVLIGKKKCRGKFKELISYKNDPSRGNVCKRSTDTGYRCPKGCFKTESGQSPFCQSSENDNSPCRTGKNWYQIFDLIF